MHIFTRTAALEHFIEQRKSEGKTIGFVPTMGALHDGHISLIREAHATSDIIVCSLFVNPSQFNDAEDLLKYPRPHGQDLGMLSEVGCHVAFLPPVIEVYPPGLDPSIEVDLRGLDDVLEGEFRPGHFDGMLEVVHRLLQIVQPHTLFMGQKDYQQQLLVQHMINQLELNVNLHVCPIHRASDGLAMSSRNRRLTEDHRIKASVLHRALKHVRDHWRDQGDAAIVAAKQMITSEGLRLEYLEVTDRQRLQAINHALSGVEAIALVAAWCGDIRLIDNIYLQ